MLCIRVGASNAFSDSRAIGGNLTGAGRLPMLIEGAGTHEAARQSIEGAMMSKISVNCAAEGAATGVR